MKNPLPYVSVIIPCRNEESYIENVLLDIHNQTYPKSHLEILVIDGMSTDKTYEIVLGLQKDHPFVKILRNPGKIVPTGLNIGIKNANGDIIVRLDAHCEYPKNYIQYLVQKLYELNADNVGVAMIAFPRNNSIKALAICRAISSVFGIGDSYHRTGLNRAVKMDSVPFGCYRKEVFSRIGLFDEELIRNQDDELNARLRKAGGEIWLLPDLEIKYYARDSIEKIARMFFYYGYFKPLVNKKIGSPATIRQFIPPLFVLSQIVAVLILFWDFSLGTLMFSSIWVFYGIACVWFSAKIAFKEQKWKVFFALIPIYVSIHFSYGFGYLRGFLRFQVRGKGAGFNDLSTNR